MPSRPRRTHPQRWLRAVIPTSAVMARLSAARKANVRAVEMPALRSLLQESQGRTMLDPSMHDVIERLAEMPFRPIPSLGAVEARKQDRALYDPIWNSGQPTLVEVKDLSVMADRVHVPIRLYRPSLEPRLPALLYLHGGGFVLGGLDSHDSLCRDLASSVGCIVIAMDYRLAPEHKFPAAIDDCIGATHAIGRQADVLGIDPERIAVAGDSAGANLALNVLLEAKRIGPLRFRCGVLVYGMFSTAMRSASFQAFGSGQYLLSNEELCFFWTSYLRGEDDKHDTRCNLLQADLNGLPPLYIAAAELDPLLDDSLLLVSRLKAVAVEHEFRLWKGLVHGALLMSSAIPQVRCHLSDMARYLSSSLIRELSGATLKRGADAVYP